MENKKERIYWLDNMKGIGILVLITVAHTQQHDFLLRVERTFLMPLFFFVSGFLFKYEYCANIKVLIKEQAKHLLKPYLFFGLIAFLITFSRNIINNPDLITTMYSQVFIAPLKAMLIGSAKSLRLVNNGPLWFLPCMFSLQLIFYLIMQNAKRIGFKIVLVLIGVTVGYLFKYLPNNQNFFFSFNTSLVVLLFFSIGYFSRLYLMKFLNSLPFFILFLTIPLQLLFVSILDVPPIFAFNTYGNIPITILCCLLSVFNIIVICRALPSNMFLQGIGKNTLFIFGFHYPLLTVVLPFIFRLMHINQMFFPSKPDSPNNLFYLHLFISSLVLGLIQYLIIINLTPILRKRVVWFFN